MEIIRKFKRPLSKRIVLNIPDHYVDKDLEILIIPVDQETKKHPVNKKLLFEKLCGLWEGRDDLTLENIREKAWKRN